MSTAASPVRERRGAHPDYSRAVLQDLYRYRRKEPVIAWVLWFFTGVMGGHRLYLERTGSAVAMLFTGGAGGLWWIADAFFLRRMISAYNDEQARRQKAGLPPVSLEFLPPLGDGKLPAQPVWAAARNGRLRMMGDLLVLVVAGAGLGIASVSSGNFEGLTAILVLIAIINLGARWDKLARLPLLRALDRWNHRLRLFYHINDPGGPLSLLFRPLVASFSALFRHRARAEARLYLQLGAVFVIGFTAIDAIEALATGGGLQGSVNEFVSDMVVTFLIVYAFASPIGATLTSHVLLERTDVVLWRLSAVTVAALALGLLSFTRFVSFPGW